MLTALRAVELDVHCCESCI